MINPSALRSLFAALLMMPVLNGCAQQPASPTDAGPGINPEPTMTAQAKMKVEIWSDVLCPFCYIGKREFENALARFPAKDNVEVEWKSFQLDPSAPKRAEGDMFDMLVNKYGGTRDQAKARVGGVVERARTLGLDYRMEDAVMVNSYDAHRLIQLAKSKGLGDAIEERLFKAHFMEGADVADHATLQRLGEEVGLATQDVSALWTGDAFGDAVRNDGREGQRIGVRGVPFFVIDSKIGVSGAQASDHFLGALEQAWGDRPAPVLEMSGADGATCDPQGQCE
jgi:predicted DsbA family dithiol-disulfide isomerase